MKKILFFLVLFAPQTLFSQGNWPSYGRSSVNLKPVGVWVSGGVSGIHRNIQEFRALGEGNFEAGMTFGKEIAFVVKTGVYTQSDYPIQSDNFGDDWGGYYQQWGYNPYCGCYPQQQSDDRFQYVRFGYFQAGVSNQGKSHGIRLTGGIASFKYQIPVVDSLGNETAQVVIPNATALAIGFDVKSRIGKDLVSARAQSYTDIKRMDFAGTLGFAELDYLFGFPELNQKLYAGIGASFKKHVVSGNEYGVRAIVEFGHDQLPMWVRGYFGVAYNPLPTEGVGWQLGFQISVDRFAKSIYR